MLITNIATTRLRQPKLAHLVQDDSLMQIKISRKLFWLEIRGIFLSQVTIQIDNVRCSIDEIDYNRLRDLPEKIPRPSSA